MNAESYEEGTFNIKQVRAEPKLEHQALTICQKFECTLCKKCMKKTYAAQERYIVKLPAKKFSFCIFVGEVMTLVILIILSSDLKQVNNTVNNRTLKSMQF